MALGHGPTIITNGLVLALDAADRNSFDSSENFLTYSNFSFSSITAYPTGWTEFNPGRVVRSIGQSPDGTDAAIVGKRYNNSGGFRPTSVTLSASTNYTVSFYARKPTDSELSLFLSYYPTNDSTTQPYTKGVKIRYDDTDNSTGSTNSTSFTLTDTWQRFTYTFNSGSDTVISPNFSSLTVADAYDSNGLFVIASVQVERGSSASPYYPTTGMVKNRGSTLIDLSGRENNGTLTNGPTYSSANGGSIVYDGVNDYALVTNPSTIRNQDFTVSIWVNPGVQNSSIISMIDFDHANANGWVLQSEDATTNRYYYFAWWNGYGFEPTGGGGYGAGKGIQITTSVWQNIVYSKSGTSLLGYMNGNQVYTGTAGSSNVSYGSNRNLRIGDWISTGRALKGNISNTQIYNRALTASEIQQNFNSVRSRFGI
jgi:hypothetical protein